VGTDIAPGTYESAGPAAEGDALTKKSQIVQIDPTDTAFTTNDFQPWQKAAAGAPA
jgi:hypothetical protein